MKKALIVLLFTLIISSCSSSDNSWTVSWLEKYDWTNFEVMYPSWWNILEKDSSNLPKPKNWEIAFSAYSKEISYWFSNNVLILSQDLNKDISSEDFSILNNVWATKEYQEYTKIDSKKITFSDEDYTTMYDFEAKYNTDTTKLKFLQAWKVCDKKAFLITIALSPDIKDSSSYEEIIKSFKCK